MNRKLTAPDTAVGKLLQNSSIACLTSAYKTQKKINIL